MSTPDIMKENAVLLSIYQGLKLNTASLGVDYTYTIDQKFSGKFLLFKTYFTFIYTFI